MRLSCRSICNGDDSQREVILERGVIDRSDKKIVLILRK